MGWTTVWPGKLRGHEYGAKKNSRPWRMSLTRVEEALENLQANCVADRNNFKGDFFKEKTVEKYVFVFTPILIKLTFSGCRCAAFYERSTDSSRKLLIKCLILLGSLQGGGGREILFPLTLNLCKMTFSYCRSADYMSDRLFPVVKRS